ncbi:RpiR family carbohydrate utilization transcriptional regulator [Paracidovorax anthurii]|uniref:RpiR family carbohydrate utilization transcriptional regulator n=1 Tax=Paracidovorax anthurii TaxID=78229 RepID=A0A328YSR9_9BURK|nr:RpiR family carbohydrate utilization transcriptional regulator [Paracidovorax anthurii]
MVSRRLLHPLVIDVLAAGIALRIRKPLRPHLQQMKDDLHAKRHA